MPFVIRYPKEVPASSRNSDIIENVDFSALFADYAGLDVPDWMQGCSFRKNLMGNTPDDWRKYGYYHYWTNHDDRPAHFGIRGARYKLAFFYGKLTNANINHEKTEPILWDFFDLKNDPHELHNAYNDSKYQGIIKEMKKEIMHQREMLGDNDENNTDIQNIIEKHWD